MPQRDTSGIGERIPRELINGDFAVAFSLVEMAEDESRQDNEPVASRLLQQAREMLDNIRERMLRMTASQKEAFEPRCAELAAAIDRAQTPHS